jgi:hypothetical protein
MPSRAIDDEYPNRFNRREVGSGNEFVGFQSDGSVVFASAVAAFCNQALSCSQWPFELPVACDQKAPPGAF